MNDSPFTTPQCVCGHSQGDHKSNRAPFAGTLRFGICLRRNCRCRQYEPVTELDRLETENRQLRELLATLGWTPARLAEHLAVHTGREHQPGSP